MYHEKQYKVCCADYIPDDVWKKSLSFLNTGFLSPNVCVFPGFCDVHVHFREPGFLYKETIKTGSMAAAHGGYTDVCTMPNLNPVPDSQEHLAVQQEIISSDAVIGVHPYGAITVGQAGEELAALDEMADSVVAFSDDGRGVQSEALMREAMRKARQLGKILVAHCEDNRLLYGGYIHKGQYAQSHGHAGICSESEWKPIERDIRLAKETGCAYHVCHISCKESVERIRRAKADGVDITCETAPHYLLLDENDLQEDGRFKMNPPLRSREDRLALIDGILDGTIDMIATDHAPHSAEEKARGLKGSAFGIVGIETAFPLLYTYLVRQNRISLEKLVELICINPRKRFGIPFHGFTVWDLDAAYDIRPETFLSKGKATPFENTRVYGNCLMTVFEDQMVYQNTEVCDE